MKQRSSTKEKNTRKKAFTYLAPIGDEEINAAAEVLKSRRLSGFYKDFLGGEKVREFESDFADYTGVRHAISVNSGTSALHIAIAALGIGPGDEVIVPPFTFTATVSAVLMNNAVPVFADIEPETFCISPAKIKKAITARTKAIIPVHIYGKMAGMDEIIDIASEKGVRVIEDACQSPGCTYKGRKAGSMADAGVFSFVETKNMVIGEGGMVTTNDDGIAERCRLIRNHGEVWMEGKPRQYLSNILGYNFRLTEVPAAIGIEQLKKLDRLNGIRRENASYLEKALSGLKAIRPMEYADGEICHLYPVLFDEKEAGMSRDEFIGLINEEGVPVSRGYPHPLYRNPIFTEKIAYGDKGCPYTCPFYGKETDYRGLRCEVAEDVCGRLVCIKHVHYPYGVEDMRSIVEAFKKILYGRR